MSIGGGLEVYTAYIILTFIKTIIVPTAKGPWERQEYRSDHYNCYGKLFRAHRAYPAPGEKWRTGVMLDQRSLDAMQKGCCPPALMKEFLETERFEAEGGDYAEEAMKLHKKGYLGGL